MTFASRAGAWLGAWLLLASAYARRAVILWAALPPILAMIVEEIVFDTSYVAQLLRHRLVGWTQFGAHGDGERIQIDGEAPFDPEEEQKVCDSQKLGVYFPIYPAEQRFKPSPGLILAPPGTQG